MSGLEVISAISAVISIVDGLVKLCKAIENTSHLPQGFREIPHRLPLVRDTLLATETRLQKYDADGDAYTAIKAAVESCRDRADRLRNIIQDVAAQPEASRIGRYRLAVRRLGKEGTVEKLMKGMLEDVQLVAANQAVKALGQEEMTEIIGAIQALSKATPSTDPEIPTFTYRGSGSQFNNTGGGTQNINKGRGHQNFAHTMSFTRP